MLKTSSRRNRVCRDLVAMHLIGHRKSIRAFNGFRKMTKRLITRLAGSVC